MRTISFQSPVLWSSFLCPNTEVSWGLPTDRTPQDQWSKLLFWGHFVGSDRSGKIVRPGCGWAHYPPNGERDYDWSNPKYVETHMDAWKPDGSKQKTRLNCQRWRGNSLRWFIYWMQHLPGPNNSLTFHDQPLNNWWVFIGDYDRSKLKGLGLMETSASPRH